MTEYEEMCADKARERRLNAQLAELRDERRERFEADEAKLLKWLCYELSDKYGDKTVVMEFMTRCLAAAVNSETLDDVAFDMAQEHEDDIFVFFS